jgi:hypothetical protein
MIQKIILELLYLIFSFFSGCSVVQNNPSIFYHKGHDGREEKLYFKLHVLLVQKSLISFYTNLRLPSGLNPGP